MNLKEARKSAIKYCAEKKCDYAYISYKDDGKFYVTGIEGKHTVYFVSKNGSLKSYFATNYASDFHKERKKRKQMRDRHSKRKMAELSNHVDETDEADVD